MKNIFLSDAEYEQLAAQTENLIAEVEELPYPAVKEKMHHLLDHFDMLHREALTRLFREIIINHPDLHTKMESDKAIHLLFSLYDLFYSSAQNNGLEKEDLLNRNSSGYPLWLPVGNIAELKDNTAYKYAEEGEDILICKTEGTVHAVKNCCGNTALPLEGAVIEKGYLICPWHGCVYRLSDGALETNPVRRLKKYPIEISADGEIQLGLNM